MAGPPPSLLIPTVILEYTVLALFVAGTAFYQAVLWRRKVFHLNLHFLLAIGPLTQYIYIVPFHFRAIYKLFGVLPSGPKRTLWLFEDIAIIGSTFNLLAITVERAVATALVNSYEDLGRKFPLLSIGVTIVQWSISYFIITKIYDRTWTVVNVLIILAVTIAITAVSKLTVVNVLIILAVTIAITAVVFALLPLISRHVHRANMVDERRFAQGVKRYQSVENVRSAKVLNRYALFLVVFVAFSLVILYIFKEQSGAYYDYVEVVFNIYYAGGGLLAEALVCFSHPVLKEETMRIFAVFRPTRIPAVEKRRSTVKSIQGQELNINSEAHTSVYFNLYRDAW